MKLNERELDEVEALGLLIKSVLINPDVKDWEVYDAIMKLNDLGKKYLARGMTDKDDLPNLDLQYMKDLIEKFMHILMKRVNEDNPEE